MQTKCENMKAKIAIYDAKKHFSLRIYTALFNRYYSMELNLLLG